MQDSKSDHMPARPSSSAVRRIRLERKKARRAAAAAARRGRAGALQKLFRTPAAYRKKARCAKGKKRVGRVCKPAGHVKVVGTKAEVYKGKAKHTSGGLTKSQIVRLSLMRGGKKVHRYVSAKKHARGKSLARRGSSRILRAWRMAVKRVTGGPIPRKGTADYKRAKALYLKLVSGGLSAEQRPAVRTMRASSIGSLAAKRARRGPRGTRKARR
jgi:hypothetical protein